MGLESWTSILSEIATILQLCHDLCPEKYCDYVMTCPENIMPDLFS